MWTSFPHSLSVRGPLSPCPPLPVSRALGPLTRLPVPCHSGSSAPSRRAHSLPGLQPTPKHLQVPWSSGERHPSYKHSSERLDSLPLFWKTVNAMFHFIAETWSISGGSSPVTLSDVCAIAPSQLHANQANYICPVRGQVQRSHGGNRNGRLSHFCVPTSSQTWL